MSENEEATAEVAETNAEEVSVQSVDEMAAALEDKEVGMELTGEYLSMDAGDVVRAYVVGTKQIDAKGKAGEKVTAIRLLLADTTTVITADVVLRSTLEGVATKVENKEVNAPAVEITCTGEETTPNGTYKTFTVKELN